MEQQFIVGGSVRDVLLGIQPKDVDFVWTGSSHDLMIARGFTQVGSSFPVYLDHLGQEHALARSERKTNAGGYYGFSWDTTEISIEEDLMRRDLTINSLAVRVEDWTSFQLSRNVSLVVDPWGGVNDLGDALLRHTSPAYSEDVIRVLRTARFAARYGFDVDPDTKQLMWEVAEELNHVPQERIWAEIEKGLMEEHPWTMFDVLDECGAMEVNALKTYRAVDLIRMRTIKKTTPISVRFCLTGIGFEDKDYERCRIPTELARASKAFNKHFVDLFHYSHKTAEERVAMFDTMRAFSNIDVLMGVVAAMSMYTEYIDPDVLEDQILADLRATMSVNAAHIASQCSSGAEIKQKLFEARVRAMEGK